MATVTGMTAAAMIAIRDGTVVSASFDSANHLILTKYDGSQIDAGTVSAATDVKSGLVELATSAETLTGTDNARAVTPAGLASIPGNKVQTLTSNSKLEADLPSTYPIGVSIMTATTGSTWSIGFGIVMSAVTSTTRAAQSFYSSGGGSQVPREWFRTYHDTNGGGGWTAWREVLTDPGAWPIWVPTWSTTSGIHLPSFGNAVLDCRYNKVARKVEGKFEITFGSSTNFGTTPATGDNWIFSLPPVAAARSTDTIGFVHMQGSSNAAAAMGAIKLLSTSTFTVALSSGRPDAIATTNTGDIDSITPWTWANLNTVKGTFVYESAS